MRRTGISLLLLALSGAAAAQDWPHEPSSVMGVQLGGPASSLPVCPPVVASDPNSYRTPSFLCVDPIGKMDRSGSLKGLPFDFSRGGSVMYDGGTIGAIHMIIGQDEYARMKGILVERYGLPSRITANTVTSIAGAVLSSEEAVWAGKSMTIVLVERSDRVNLSRVVFSSNAYAKRQGQQRGESVKRDASKL